MNNEIALTNTSFNFLRGSSSFLGLILENISSCILMLNNKMELQAFNNSLKTIFSNKENEDVLYHRCGEVIGCAHSVEEEKECGNTTHCQFCDLRLSALLSYTNNETIYKDKISRYFYTSSSQKVMKHLQFSTRSFQFENDKYIIMIIEDITKSENQIEKIKEQYMRIQSLEANI